VGQKKYQRPLVKTPDTFRGADGSSASDQTSIGDLKWFEVFKDEELQKLVRTAMVRIAAAAQKIFPNEFIRISFFLKFCK